MRGRTLSLSLHAQKGVVANGNCEICDLQSHLRNLHTIHRLADAVRIEATVVRHPVRKSEREREKTGHSIEVVLMIHSQHYPNWEFIEYTFTHPSLGCMCFCVRCVLRSSILYGRMRRLYVIDIHVCTSRIYIKT